MFTSSALYLAIGSFVKFVTELNGDVNLNTELYLLNDFDDQEKDVEEFEVPKYWATCSNQLPVPFIWIPGAHWRRYGTSTTR
uniref:Uncharacterized protein n=1 Tax=Trichuris muris TaxID=70415 RepID=A0A5S6PZP1_TRIMR